MLSPARVLILISLVFAAAGCGVENVAAPDCACKRQPILPKPKELSLRYDGVYYSPLNGFSDYLRFSPDGGVNGIVSAASPEEVADWFDRNDSNRLRRGSVMQTGNRISFRAASSQGEVDYDGVLLEQKLELNVRSEIAEIRGSRVYNFFQTGGKR